jgi:hypothetical protein
MINSSPKKKPTTPNEWRKRRQERKAQSTKILTVLDQQKGKMIDLYALQALVKKAN